MAECKFIMQKNMRLQDAYVLARTVIGIYVTPKGEVWGETGETLILY